MESGKKHFKSETDKVRTYYPEIVSKYLVGIGCDIGHGGDKIIKSKDCIAIDYPQPYANTGADRTELPCDFNKGVPITDAYFDYVYSSHLIEDFPSTEYALHEFIRVLKNDSILFLVFPDQIKYVKYCIENNIGLNDHHKHATFGKEWVLNSLKNISSKNGILESYNIEFISDCDVDYNVILVLRIKKNVNYASNFRNKKVLLQRMGAGGDVLMSEPIIRHFLERNNTVHFRTSPYDKATFKNYETNSTLLMPDKWDGPYDLVGDLNYEWSPQELAQTSMAKHVGLVDFQPSKPKLFLTPSQKQRKVTEPYVILHKENSRNLNYRNVYGIDWKIVVDKIIKMGYRVCEIGRDSTQKHGEDIRTNNWVDIASWIYNCEFFIGLDSGPAHIASTFNKRSVLIFGSVNPEYRFTKNALDLIEVLHTPCPLDSKKYCYHEITDSPEGPVCQVEGVGLTGNPPCCTFTTKDMEDLIDLTEAKVKEESRPYFEEKDVTFVIPSRNNYEYITSIVRMLRDYYPNASYVLLSDASTDQTTQFFAELPQWCGKLSVHSREQFFINEGPETNGIAKNYNIGASMAKTKVIMFIHADMVPAKNMLPNLLKYLKPGVVVSATRIEPPLHPSGPEKITKDFGMVPSEFKHGPFIDFCAEYSKTNDTKVTNGIFTPWIICKEDFDRIGGHDWKLFKTYQEDSDIFLRFTMAGYELLQSWSALVYHYTCRGSRFLGWDGKGIPQKSTESLNYELTASKNHVRKWGHSVQHNEFMMPKGDVKWEIELIVKNSNELNPDILTFLEVHSSRIVIDSPELVTSYIGIEQSNTTFDLSKRVLSDNSNLPKMDVSIQFDSKEFQHAETVNSNAQFIRDLPKILTDSVDEPAEFSYGIFNITVRQIRDLAIDNLVFKDVKI